MSIAGYSLENVIAYFPDSASISMQEPVEGRNGSMGSEILKRFDVFPDFTGQKMYLRPNRFFSDEFHPDMSGLEILSGSPDHPDFFIYRVRVGSPAWKAGCRHGGQKLFIIGNEGDKRVRITSGQDIPEFDVELEGESIAKKEIVKELVIDETYLAEWEAEVMNGMTRGEGHEGGIEQGDGHGDDAMADLQP